MIRKTSERPTRPESPGKSASNRRGPTVEGPNDERETGREVRQRFTSNPAREFDLVWAPTRIASFHHPSELEAAINARRERFVALQPKKSSNPRFKSSGGCEKADPDFGLNSRV